MWPFRRSQTLQDGPERHQTTLDLIEQVAILRGRLGAMEVEWENVKDTVKKSYQRIEKAQQRAEGKRHDDSDEPEPQQQEDPGVVLHEGFAAKLQRMKG